MMAAKGGGGPLRTRGGWVCVCYRPYFVGELNVEDIWIFVKAVTHAFGYVEPEEISYTQYLLTLVKTKR